MIAENGKQVVIHTVITGGQAIRDTLAGFASLVEQMPEQARIVVWLNEFFGNIVAEGKEFEEMKVYLNNKDRVHGIVRIPRQTGSTDTGRQIRVTDFDTRATLGNVSFHLTIMYPNCIIYLTYHFSLFY